MEGFDNASGDSTQPPAGITVQEHQGSLVVGYKDTSGARFVVLILAGMGFFTCLMYVLGGRAPVSELPWAALVFSIPGYFGVAMAVNTTTFTIGEKEVAISRGPIPVWPTKRLPRDQFNGLYIRKEPTKHGRVTFALYAGLGQENKPKSMKRFGRNHDEALFILNVLSKRMGVPTRVTRW